jgi:hypothetical protein
LISIVRCDWFHGIDLLVERYGETDHMRKAVHKLGPVIPGRHRKVASPESIALGQWLWIPGSRKSAPRNDGAFDSNFKSPN